MSVQLGGEMLGTPSRRATDKKLAARNTELDIMVMSHKQVSVLPQTSA